MDTSQSGSTCPPQPPIQPVRVTATQKQMYVAIYDYDPVEEGDLELCKVGPTREGGEGGVWGGVCVWCVGGWGRGVCGWGEGYVCCGWVGGGVYGWVVGRCMYVCVVCHMGGRGVCVGVGGCQVGM